MITPTAEQRRLVNELLREKPFECSRAFFFELRQAQVVPLDPDSARLYERDRTIVNALPREPLQGWAGNIIAGPQQGAQAYFYASYRFGPLMVVVSKVVEVAPGQGRPHSPFNTYFVDAIADRIAPIVGGLGLPKRGGEEASLEGKQMTPFNELVAWRQCKRLWREKFPGLWIAIKGSQPVATASSAEDLDAKVRALNVEPPLLYAPPEGKEEVYDVVSARAGHAKPSVSS